MKRYSVLMVPALVFVLAASLPGNADTYRPVPVSAHERNQARVRRLIQSVPTPRELADFTALFQRKENARNRRQFQQARQRLRLAETRIPQLFALLRPGTRLSDFPGLREAGHFNADFTRDRAGHKILTGYWLHVGGEPLSYSESAPTEFVVRMDKKGIITDADDLVCRR